MNSVISTELVKTATEATSILPVANSVVDTLGKTVSGLSTTQKVAIGAGITGVVVVGGVVGYKMWRKTHPKQPKDGASATETAEKPLDDEADEIPDMDEAEVLAVMHELAVALAKRLYSEGYTDEKALWCMVSTCLEEQFEAEVSFKFVKDTVAAGIAAAKSESEKKDEPKK